MAKKCRNISAYYVMDDILALTDGSLDAVSNNVIRKLDKTFNTINSGYSSLMRDLVIQNEKLNRDLAKKNDEIRKLEYELVATRTSLSCRIGLLITFIPRKLFRRK